MVAILHHLLMDKCKHATSRVRKRYAFDLFKALTRKATEVQRPKFASANVSRTREELFSHNDTLNQSNLAAEDNRSHQRGDSRVSHHRASSNTGNKVIITADTEGDWFELFWGRKRQDLMVDSFKYKTGE